MTPIRLTELRKGATALIKEVGTYPKDTEHRVNQKLSAIGILHGRTVKMCEKNSFGLIIKVEDDSKLAIEKPLSNIIIVEPDAKPDIAKPLKSDVFEQRQAKPKHRNNLFAKIIQLLF